MEWVSQRYVIKWDSSGADPEIDLTYLNSDDEDVTRDVRIDLLEERLAKLEAAERRRLRRRR